jgi:molybdopterin molybdotransferase
MRDRALTISPITMKRRVLAAVRPVGTEWLPIESSRGRILAESVKSRFPSPRMDCSMMDGYAVRHQDLRGASRTRPIRLTVWGEIGAGERMRGKLPADHAARIMTGAPLPSGADCVVPLERVRLDGDDVLLFEHAPRFNDVRQAGSEIRRNQIVLIGGSVIGPAQMAMLAFLDRPRVRVHRRPRVGIISTGDELGAVGQRRPYGHIPDSNRYGLLGLVESAGCVPIDGGRVGDQPAILWKRLMRILPRADFIITSGGVSVGDRDVVKALFHQKEAVNLYRLPIKPGKPQAFGRIGRTPFFGLPGNPVSAMVVFDLLVRPALRKLAGAANVESPRWTATVTRDFPRKTRQWEFPRAAACERDGRWYVAPVPSQKSSNLKSMTDADGYVILSPSSPPPVRGAEVIFMPLPR